VKFSMTGQENGDLLIQVTARGGELKKKVSSGGNCLSPIKLPHYY
jgi:hypothetical protein